MTMRIMHITRALTLATTIVLPACGSNSPSASAPAAAAPPATSSEVTGIVPKFALVTLLPATNSVPMPSEAAVMDQQSKQFLPNTLLVRVGQPVEFRNSEDMPHNVSVTRRESGSEVFNVSTEANQKYVHTFDRVGQFDVKCDIHEGMEATVIAARGPLTTIAGDDGRFSLPNVAFGSYKVSLTFNGQTVEHAVEVSGARTEVKIAR